MKPQYFLFVILLLLPLHSSAQRTSKGTMFISADGLCTFSSFGGQLSWGRYLSNSYVEAGANCAFRSCRQDTGILSYTLAYAQFTATADFMYRLCASRSRCFTLNGGGGVLLGAEVYDPLNQRPREVSLSETGGTFIYGVDARIQMELYASRMVAFVLAGRIPFTIGSLCSVFNYEASLGVRVNF